MRHFLWKIAGGDCDLLERSGTDSQYSFSVIGVLYLLINLTTYIGFFGMFYGVFDHFVPAIFGTLVLGFLVTNIYRLNLISLEPHTLPVLNEGASVVATYVLRYITISMFAFFVSKCFEMVIISAFETSGLYNYNGSKDYLIHMTNSNIEHPWIWIVTAVIILLFLSPIYLRHRLDRAHEYYSLKERRDIRLVIEQYEDFLNLKSQILSGVYSNYKKIGQEKIYTYKKRFKDEPFNTKPIENKRDLGSSEDFLNAILKR